MFGLASLAMGGAIFWWVIYNVFIERQEGYSGPSFILGLGSFGLGAPLILYGLFTLGSCIRRKEEGRFLPGQPEDVEPEEDDGQQAV